MKYFHSSTRMAIGAVSLFVAVCSITANARGYSPSQPNSNAHEQQIEKRLSQIEEQQKAMQAAMAAEFKKLRADLESTKDQQAVTAKLTAGK